MTGPYYQPDVLRRRLRRAGCDTGEDLPPVAWFGDDPAMARELGQLVRAGGKTATAGLLWKWRADDRPLPVPGDRQVIIDWDGTPLAVIEMTDVTVVAFDDVDAAFARAEGEGDRSLATWREIHWAFFTRECRRIGRAPAPDMPVICMQFRLTCVP